jgi:hypothetical protein
MLPFAIFFGGSKAVAQANTAARPAQLVFHQPAFQAEGLVLVAEATKMEVFRYISMLSKREDKVQEPWHHLMVCQSKLKHLVTDPQRVPRMISMDESGFVSLADSPVKLYLWISISTQSKPKLGNVDLHESTSWIPIKLLDAPNTRWLVRLAELVFQLLQIANHGVLEFCNSLSR